MVIVGMTGHARSRVQGSGLRDIVPKIFWSFAPERLKVEISAKNLNAEFSAKEMQRAAKIEA